MQKSKLNLPVVDQAILDSLGMTLEEYQDNMMYAQEQEEKERQLKSKEEEQKLMEIKTSKDI